MKKAKMVSFVHKKYLTALFFLFFLCSFLKLHSMISSRQTIQQIDSIRHRVNAKQWCQFPKLDINDSTVMRYYSGDETLDCSKNEKNWVYVRNGTFYIDSEAEVRHGGKIRCNYTDIRRGIDDYEVDMKMEENFKNGSKLKGDFFRIDCKVDGSNANHWNYYAHVVRSEEAVERSKSKSMPKNALGLNVYMIAFDSLSRLAFIRNLPKMYKYLTKEMDAIVLNGYNILGDGTPQALIPMFTGKTEEELPLTRKRFDNATSVDVYPFVWNKYRDAGYITLFGEDAADVGTFSDRLKGFKVQPTDHYMRTFYLEVYKIIYKTKFCLGNEDQYRVHFDYVRHFWDAYPIDTPKFAFQFLSYYSHNNYDMIRVVDDYMVEHLKYFVDNGHWNNTIMIVMADHGHRFGGLRETAQGKLEERLPFFSFAFPPWFKNRYPETIRVFKENTARLTSPFDIHATLQEILKFRPKPNMKPKKKRGLSLFHPIPIDRPCNQAGIEVHWCTCLQWTEVPISGPIVQSIAADLVKTINEKTQRDRKLCAEIKLSKIEKALKYTPATDLLKYSGAQDSDGFVPDLSGEAAVFNLEYYQLDVWTEPGKAHYEASITWDKATNKSIVDLDVVSHVNEYGDQPHCIAKIDPWLLKWCKCFDKI